MVNKGNIDMEKSVRRKLIKERLRKIVRPIVLEIIRENRKRKTVKRQKGKI
jgi:hypothetical protein